MNVILFGATGMVGQGVLRECLRDDVVGTGEGSHRECAARVISEWLHVPNRRFARHAWRGIQNALDANYLRGLSPVLAAGACSRAWHDDHDLGVRTRDDPRSARRCVQASVGKPRPTRTWAALIER